MGDGGGQAVPVGAAGAREFVVGAGIGVFGDVRQALHRRGELGAAVGGEEYILAGDVQHQRRQAVHQPIRPNAVLRHVDVGRAAIIIASHPPRQ